ncbi:anti-sigma factor [Lentimicrobium sp. S6]|uniref:anti-sigma factor n=1 Tax=Lentimicrobium sp. S6 TaxID=2735872 RepID=UPI0015536512|nr:anti-sigma factor [Lentimicrobium sp. S6]NPD46522.1 anti-sigma factor [Lentimicrobium sp. S6]
MIKVKSIILLALMALVFVTSCKKDEEAPVSTNGNLNIEISGLEDLGSDYAYEGWIIVDGKAISSGVFEVDATGMMSKTSFEVALSDLNAASTYVLTIEPNRDTDPNPSSVHVLAGDIDGGSASLSVAHGAALGNDFSSSTGAYILATPTDGGSETDENSGVWWLDPSAGPAASLDLPVLPAGWAYEGWAVVDGIPISTGRFLSTSGADQSDIYSGQSADAPPFPGEDLLMNAPNGVSFPTDLAGKTVVISVEPQPDNSAAPFLLKPLVGAVPSDATDRTLYQMSNNAANTNPSGMAKKK